MVGVSAALRCSPSLRTASGCSGVTSSIASRRTKVRGLRLVDEIADNLSAVNEHSMLLGVAELDDLLEDIDRDDDLLGRAATVRLRQGITEARESIAAGLTDEPSSTFSLPVDGCRTTRTDKGLRIAVAERRGHVAP